jgi:3-oxoacyl-[acyl-carrier protein] reductase
MSQVCIITGASRGIGQAAAVELDKLGWRLVLVSRTASELAETAGGLSDTLTVVADVSRSDEVQRVVDATIEHYGQVDATVNCAGAAPLVPIAKMTDQEFHLTIETNLGQVFYMTRALWPYFARQKAGVIVNLSSLSSRDPFLGFGVYGAAKAGINLFSLMTAREGAAVGIRCHVVAPGAVETKMLRERFPTSVLPAEKALPASSVGKVIAQLVAGDMACTSGEVIYVHQ